MTFSLRSSGVSEARNWHKRRVKITARAHKKNPVSHNLCLPHKGGFNKAALSFAQKATFFLPNKTMRCFPAQLSSHLEQILKKSKRSETQKFFPFRGRAESPEGPIGSSTVHFPMLQEMLLFWSLICVCPKSLRKLLSVHFSAAHKF